MRAALLAVPLAALLLAGCGGTDDAGPTTPGATMTQTPPSEPTPTATTPLEDLPVTPPGGRAERTLTGTVEPGVEAGCLLLDQYLLMGPLAADLSGEVTVTGYADPSMMTTCQQGTPFVVTKVG